MKTHEHRAPAERTIQDELAENEANRVARGLPTYPWEVAASLDPWADFAQTDEETGIPRAASFHRESENLASESLTGEELEVATHVILSSLEAEKDNPPYIIDEITGYRKKDGRRVEYIRSDISAIFAVRQALKEGYSVEAARNIILDRPSQRPALVLEQRGKYGRAAKVTSTARNVRPDGSISPLDRVTDGETYDCRNFYVDHRALQYLDYIIEHPDEILEMISSEEPELPEVFQGPLYVDEDGEISSKQRETVVA